MKDFFFEFLSVTATPLEIGCFWHWTKSYVGASRGLKLTADTINSLEFLDLCILSFSAIGRPEKWPIEKGFKKQTPSQSSRRPEFRRLRK